jgi:PAS domain S-box-containing protein
MEDRPLHVQQVGVMTGSDIAAQALAAAGDAVVTVDLHGQITSWNHAAEAMLGHRPDQVLRQTLALIISEAHRPRHVAAFHAAIESGVLAHSGRPARVAATTGNGEVIPLVMSLGLLTGPDEKPAGAVAILRRAEVEHVSFVGTPTERP